MADTFKILGQVAPVTAALTDAYPVPAATQAIISAIVVCNRSAAGTAFRLSVAPGGAANADAHYIAYDMPIGGNQSIPFQVQGTLGATDVIRVYAALTTISFNVFGMEIT